MRALLLALALTACNNDTQPTPDALDPLRCDSATEYMGDLVPCNDGAGVCVARGPEIRCLDKCGTDPACVDATWETILLRDGSNVCYCRPH